MTQLNNEIYAVKVPEGAKELHCEESLSGKPYLAYKFKDDLLLNEYEHIALPPGSYEFLFTSDEATEEQARKVVAWIEISGKVGYYDYMNPEPYRYFDNYADSLRSLLASKGCEGEWAVVRKYKTVKEK